MSFKKFNEFIAEGMQTSMGDNPAGEEFNMSPSTNYVSQETDLKQVNPDYVDDDDEDKWNPSIINKDAVKSGDVTFVGKKKSKSRGLDTFGNRKNQYLTNFATNESTELEVGIEVEMEHTDDRKEAEKIAKDHLSEDPKYYSKLLAYDFYESPK